MTQMPQPTLGPGKLCYVEIPAVDVERSARFYEQAFGWSLRERGDGAIAFDDGVGQVSGTWVTGRTPMGEAGLMLYVMTGDIGRARADVVAAGGEIAVEVDPDHPETFFWFRDPAGNLMGVYEQPGLTA